MIPRTAFSITGIVDDIGEVVTISGVVKSFDLRGEPSETYVGYVLSGVVQVMDGSEEEVTEGLLQKGDIILFADENATMVSSVVNDNYITASTSISGIFRIVAVTANLGHVEALAKKVMDT